MVNHNINVSLKIVTIRVVDHICTLAHSCNATVKAGAGAHTEHTAPLTLNQSASTLMELPVPLFDWSSSGGPPLVALQSRCQHPKRKPKCVI